MWSLWGNVTATDILNKHITEKNLAIGTCDDCEPKKSNEGKINEYKKNLQIEQLDGHSEIEWTTEEIEWTTEEYERTTEEYEREHEKHRCKQEEKCKAEGAGCYECSDVCLNLEGERNQGLPYKIQELQERE